LAIEAIAVAELVVDVTSDVAAASEAALDSAMEAAAVPLELDVCEATECGDNNTGAS